MHLSVADHPLGPTVFIFFMQFWGNFSRIIGWHPPPPFPLGMAPSWKILDPPLFTYTFINLLHLVLDSILYDKHRGQDYTGSFNFILNSAPSDVKLWNTEHICDGIPYGNDSSDETQALDDPIENF